MFFKCEPVRIAEMCIQVKRNFEIQNFVAKNNKEKFVRKKCQIFLYLTSKLDSLYSNMYFFCNL